MLIRGRYTGFLIAMDQTILHILIVDAVDFCVIFNYLCLLKILKNHIFY